MIVVVKDRVVSDRILDDFMVICYCFLVKFCWYFDYDLVDGRCEGNEWGWISIKN